MRAIIVLLAIFSLPLIGCNKNAESCCSTAEKKECKTSKDSAACANTDRKACETSKDHCKEEKK